MTDTQYNIMLEEVLSEVVPEVWEGVYTGDDVDEYITYTYYAKGAMYADNQPTVLLRYTTVTLWVRNGVDHLETRDDLYDAIMSLEGTAPEVTVLTDSEWNQIVYEFVYPSDVGEELA